MRETTVKQILSQTKDTYSHIAFDFDKKRNWVWKGFENFLQYAKPGSKILDVGCGNGRLLQLLSNSSISYTGFDNNEKLLELAKKNHPKAIFALGEAAQLTFDNNGHMSHVTCQMFPKKVSSSILRLSRFPPRWRRRCS